MGHGDGGGGEGGTEDGNGELEKRLTIHNPPTSSTQKVGPN